MEVRVRHTLQMAHRLWNVDSKCQHLHGHTWAVTLIIIGEKEGDMLVDFYHIKRAFVDWLDSNFDHKLVLHARDPLLTYYDGPETEEHYPGLVQVAFVPTVENLCEYWIATAKVLFGNKYSYGIEVWEGESNSAATTLE